MKKVNVLLTGLALCLFAFNSCKKANVSESTTENSNDIQTLSRGSGNSGAVYIMDNSTTGNNIVVFDRNSGGMLTAAGSYSTGGMGTGNGLGSQGSLIVKGNYLYACNAGSNEISVLQTSNSGITLIDKVSSNGMRPISVTVKGDLLYVLNAGGSGNISGFHITSNHHLTPIANSTQALSTSSSAPAQIEFNPSGSQLVVTEKATDKIVTYAVDSYGVASAGVVNTAAGTTPFGFAFGKNNRLIVSDAFGGAPGLSAVTSYSLSNSGALGLVSGPVATMQTAACWIVITKNGKYCYTTNTGSNNISGYQISNSGVLTLLNSNGITAVTGGAPIDMSLCRNSKCLYTLNTSGNSISMFTVNNNGSLNALGDITGLLPGSVGMAAE